MHQRRAVAIGHDRKRFGVEESAGVVNKIHPQIGQPAPLFLAVGRLSQEKGDVIVRIGLRFAARARTEQYDTLDLIAVYFLERRFEAL